MIPRFYDILSIAQLLGGKVEGDLISGRQWRTDFGSRAFNKRLKRARIFWPLLEQLMASRRGRQKSAFTH